MIKECIERLRLAIGQDPKIICNSKEEAGNHPGNSEKYLDELGLEKNHLKKLQKIGIAFVGYVDTKKGWIKRWILVRKDTHNGW